MSVDTTCFGAGARISSEYLPNCKPVFCSRALCLSAKAYCAATAAPAQPLPLSPDTSLDTHALSGGWMGPRSLASLSLPDSREAICSSQCRFALCLHRISLRQDFSSLPIVFLTCCHYFVDYATKKVIISFLSGLISQSNLNGIL